MSSNATGRIVSAIAFALGLATVAWVGAGFVGSNAIALAMTLAIGAVYVLGAMEVRRFRAASASLATALAEVPEPLASLGDWLDRVHPALRNAVRLRIEGERVALPGLTLTPYLVGLLVMLGMLGTFLGMVVTFKGAVFALEGSTDLQAIRSALAEPIKGLALAFGTSVAGVATSAMLGLMSAISRRGRLEVARQLDTQIAAVFRPFSLVHQRQETYKALQLQAHALPEVAGQLRVLMEQMEHRNQQLDEQLLNRQEQFHREVSVAYTDLARSVRQSLGESLGPVVESAMTAIAQESRLAHERVSAEVQTQLTAVLERFGATAGSVADTWTAALQNQAATSAQLVGGLERALAAFTGTFEQRSAALLDSVHATVSRAQAEQALAEQQKRAAWMQGLESMATALREEWQHAGAGMLARQQAVCEVLENTAGAITERDNLALQERATLMQGIGALLQSVDQATGEQRAAIESLVRSAGAVLDQVGRQFSETLGAQTVRAEDAAAQVAGSAIELASLGEAFQHGVQLFSATNEKLVDGLQRMEDAIGRSMARSDEQLAYYVAQAREVIDLSISAQHGIVEDLRRLHGTPAAAAGELA